MGAPVLPWFGGEFMGVKPPTSSPRRFAKHQVGVATYPSPFSSDDGSYLVLLPANYVNFYNKSQALVWTLMPANTPLSGATHIFALHYNVDNATLYGIAHNSANANYMLFKFNSPATSNSVSAVGTAFTVSEGGIYTGAITHVLNNCTLSSAGNGNIRLRIIESFVHDVILDAATGVILSNVPLVQGGITISYGIYGLSYTSLNGTIEFGGLALSNGRLHGLIMRNGYFARVPINFIGMFNTYTSTSVGSIVCTAFADYVKFTAITDDLPIGITSFNRIDFDRWLVDVCNAMGI